MFLQFLYTFFGFTHMSVWRDCLIMSQASHSHVKHNVAAIERELRTQKQNLVAQRDDYIRKSKVFERELGLLRTQEEELSAESTRENERIIQENHKLQVCFYFLKWLVK